MVLTAIITVLLAANLALLIAILLRQKTNSGSRDAAKLHEDMIRLEEHMNSGLRAGAEYNAKLREEMADSLREGVKVQADQLGRLYRSLGELQELSSGVNELNKTLANVKTRGIWGEVQLKRILEETMTPGQYDENIATRRNSDERVEFAVRFPAQDGSGDFVYLPIDSKFPADLYNRIADAEDRGDVKGIAEASAALKTRILEEARTIRDKYLDPPRTTNYAILFLPTEGLYAETLRIDGLFDRCRRDGILIAGPTTVTAILNGLQAGFRNVAISRKSHEVLKLLEAVKTQFGRLEGEVEKAQKKLSEAVSAVDRLQARTQTISRRMKKLQELDPSEADAILGSDEEN